MESLMDGWYTELVEIDMIEFTGPAFADVDNRLMALRLVQKGLSPSAMFTADGNVVHPAEALYKKAVLIERSRFRPPTNLNINMLDCARKQFVAEREINDNEVLVLSEMTLHNLRAGSDTGSDSGNDIDVADFLHRTEILCALGKNVMISSLGEYYRLAAYLFRYTQKPMGVVMGIPTLREVFDEKYYNELAGGILESFGKLFKYDLRMYVCPTFSDDKKSLITVDNIKTSPHLQHLFAYLYDNGFIKGLNGIQTNFLNIFSHEILSKIKAGKTEWEQCVPPVVAKMIRDKHLFGCGDSC